MACLGIIEKSSPLSSRLDQRRSTRSRTTYYCSFQCCSGYQQLGSICHQPSQPQNVSTDVVNATVVTLSWTPPTMTNDDIIAYNVWYNQTLNCSGSLVSFNDSVTGYEMTYNFTGLEEDTPYVFHVSAQTSAGEGEPAEVMGRTLEDVPSAAPEFTITAITATSFTVSWQPLPACEKNGVITGYTISVTKEGMPFTSQNVTPNVLSMNFSSLTPFVTYGVRMSASSVIGQGMLSPEVTIRTNESEPSQPQNVSADVVNTTVVTLSWTPPAMPNGDIIAYNVWYNQTLNCSGSLVSFNDSVTGYEMMYIFTGLEEDTPYVFHVSAETSAGEGEPAEVMGRTLEDVPSAAPEFTITAITATSFTVSWQPLPACEKNGVITGYTISVTKEEMPFISQNVTPNVLSMNFSSLTPFVTYGVRMSASSVIGQGMLSPEVTIRTNESEPSKPQTVSTDIVSATVVTLLWTPPAMPNGNIIAYNVWYNQTLNCSGSLVSFNDSVTGYEMTYKFTGLEEDTPYVFHVSAETIAGEGAAAIVMNRTLEDVPSAAPEFTITAITATSFTVSWQPLPACEKNGVITGYTISVTKEEMPFTSQNVTPNVLSMNFSSLTPFVTYGVRMSASSMIGQGMFSPEVTIRTNESASNTLSECKVLDVNCTDSCLHSKYRSFDGTCNNVKHPCYGAAEMAFLRLLEADYENGTNLPRGWSQSDPFSPPKPSARVISTQLFSTRNVTRHSHNTLMLMQIGQFLDHDMDHAPTVPSDKVFMNGSTCADLCGRELPCFPITIPPNDTRIRNKDCMAFTRSSTVCGSNSSSLLVDKATHPCEQINSITSFIDASMVYGSRESISIRLRESGTGRLSMGVESIPGKRFLPFVTDPVVECMQPLYSAGTSGSVPCFLAGDTRVNEHIALTSMHTLFYREHNRIADKLAELNPHWSHEKTYQEARKILGAEWQVIVYNHYIPNIVGPSGLQQLRQYEGYDSSVNPGIVNSFATAAYRFGHSQIMPIFPRFDENWEEISNGHIPLFQAFSSPFRLVQEGGIDPLIRGLISTPVKLRDAQQVLTTQVTERLFEESNDIGLDLGALNIQRGRDHGIPGYNQFRSYCSLSAAETFDDLATEIPDQEIRDKLQTLYGHPDNIDLIVGGMLEEVEEGGQLGPTFRCIIMDQFKRLRDGDRFWYQNPGVFTPFQVEELQKANLAKIICANADDIQQVPRDVFILQNVSEFVNCSEIEEVNLNAWKECDTAERCSQCESMRSKRSTGLWEAPGPDGLDIPNLVVQMNSSLHLLKKQFSSLKESPHRCRYGNEVYNTGAKWFPTNCLSCSCQNGYISCSQDC